MKRFTALLLIISLLSLTTISVAQEEEEKYVWDPLLPIKGVTGDVSIGGNGFGFGAGFRYMFAGLNIGLTGIANTSPSYQLFNPNVNINRNEPLPINYQQEKFMAMMINADLTFYLDLFEFVSINASVGFYSRNDTILAREIGGNSRIFWKNQTNSGLSYGFGGEYLVHESFSVGAMYHSQRGVMFRFNYLWF